MYFNKHKMKSALFLKQFEYAIPPSALALVSLKDNHIVAQFLQLMHVVFDFEDGIMKLEGNWQFMMSSNKHNEANWFTCHRDRVKIEAAIFPALPINLCDPASDGLVLPIEGNINDGESIGACSGLIVIDNVRGKDGLCSNQWNISFYIYDLQFDYCEISFRIPVYQSEINELNN